MVPMGNGQKHDLRILATLTKYATIQKLAVDLVKIFQTG
jgi:hypothetical protein